MRPQPVGGPEVTDRQGWAELVIPAACALIESAPPWVKLKAIETRSRGGSREGRGELRLERGMAPNLFFKPSNV